jgi:hypothetical protein
MALTGMTINYTGGAIYFCGDDMIAEGVFRPNPQQALAWGFKPKIGSVPVGEFCGFQFGHPKLRVDPRSLLHRGVMALEDGRRDAAYWRSFDDHVLLTDSGRLAPDAYVSGLLAVSSFAHKHFDLPPSKIQLSAY